MFPEVPLRENPLDSYRRSAGDAAVERCINASKSLQGASVLHLNATAFGGGVAELLYTLVPLMRSLGMDARWAVMPGHQDFFEVTKTLHNGLQGMPVTLTERMKKVFLDHTRDMASEFDRRYDFVFVHDPQPAGLLHALANLDGRPSGCWIWRCHIDLTAARPDVWGFLGPLVGAHDAAVFTHSDFAKPLGIPVAIVPPSIDPRSPKNASIHRSTCRDVLVRYRVDPARPVVCQVSRFDPWKDPIGVIDAYRLVKAKIPDLQLVMIASMAHDDPEGMKYLELTESHRAGDKDIFLLSNLQGVGNVEVNAFQRSATAVVQKSVREGFGLVVSEAMWKSKPVVGGNTGGIRLQIDDGRNGFLVDGVEEAADRILMLLRSPALSAKLGAAAREKVRRNFLSPRHLADYLELMVRVA